MIINTAWHSPLTTKPNFKWSATPNITVFAKGRARRILCRRSTSLLIRHLLAASLWTSQLRLCAISIRLKRRLPILKSFELVAWTQWASEWTSITSIAWESLRTRRRRWCSLFKPTSQCSIDNQTSPCPSFRKRKEKKGRRFGRKSRVRLARISTTETESSSWATAWTISCRPA